MRKISPRLIGVPGSATYLGVSPFTIRNWKANGRLAYHKIGGKVLFSIEELDRVVRESEHPRTAELLVRTTEEVAR